MKRALVVGIDKYPKAELRGCINDAVAIADILKKHGDNSPNFDVKLCKNVAKKGELKGLIKDCFSSSNDVDIALFYFSGHGSMDSIGGYIVTPDYQENDDGVSMSEILEIVNKSNIKNKVVILDCCHSGIIGMKSPDNKEASIREGVTLLTASKGDEYAIEQDGHGIFTTLLIEALKGGAADILGNITAGAIYNFIDQSLGPWDQRPVFKTHVTRFSPLRKVTPRVKEDVLRKIINYFTTVDSLLPLTPAYEPTNNPNIKPLLTEPYANPEKTAIFSDLQSFVKTGLVIPIGAEHMYFAAMDSKACKLTTVGQHYWNLVNEGRI